MDYEYKVGMRVGLLGRLTDVHDKGAYVVQIEGTDLHLQISEGKLKAGADLIYVKLREKHEQDEAAAADQAERDAKRADAAEDAK